MYSYAFFQKDWVRLNNTDREYEISWIKKEFPDLSSRDNNFGLSNQSIKSFIFYSFFKSYYLQLLLSIEQTVGFCELFLVIASNLLLLC